MEELAADSGVTPTSVEEWQTALSKMFPQAVQVVFDGDDGPEYLATPMHVSEDWDTKAIQWLVSASDVHTLYLPLAGAKVNSNGTLTLTVNGTTAIVRSRGTK